jgi:MFS family permease
VTTSRTPELPAAPPAGQAGTPRDPARRGLLLSIAGSQFGISMVYGAVPAVLLALQIQEMVGENKAAVLSLFLACGAVSALVAQPMAGMLSDRTRTRHGSRTPYVLGGSVLAAPALWLMGVTDSLVVLALLYVTSEFVLSAAQGPLSAILPDRVPVERRGRYSSGLGLGMVLGSVSGTVLAAALADDLLLAYLIIGTMPLLFTATRLWVCADLDNKSVGLGAVDSGAPWWKSFLVSPREHPDFWWVVGSRSLTYIGFFLVQAYSLYLLDDYVGLGEDAVNHVDVAAALTALGILVTAVPGGVLSDRLGRRKPFVLVASVTMGLGFMIPLFVPTLGGFLVMSVVIGLAFGCFESVDTALVTQSLPRSTSFAKDLGVTNVAAIAPQIIAPAIAGAIVVLTDNYAAVFPAAAVFAILGGLTVTKVRNSR